MTIKLTQLLLKKLCLKVKFGLVVRSFEHMFVSAKP